MVKAKKTILIDKKEWTLFIKAIENLIDTHTRLLDRLKVVQEELPSGTINSKLKRKDKKPVIIGTCGNCGREIYQKDKYCDRCGYQISVRA